MVEAGVMQVVDFKTDKTEEPDRRLVPHQIVSYDIIFVLNNGLVYILYCFL
jgi:hypothetical protein